MKREKQALKAILSLLLCAVMVSACIVCAFAAPSGATVLYLDKGNIVIGENSLQGYSESGALVTVPDSDGYIIRQSESVTSTQNNVTISSGTHTVEIDGISVSTPTMFAGAFSVSGNANVTLVLSGENHLHPGAYRAALEVESGATLRITGNGLLEAISGYDAGIGGGNGGDNGTVIIDSGTIIATGGSSGSGAGIGGGSSGNGGTVVINDGNITATGGNKSAGIGGGVGGNGGSITVSGGTVSAKGGKYGAGIGGGHGAAPGNIVINGGSVRATGTDGGSNIGGGYRYTGVSNVPLNSEGTQLYQCFIDLEQITSFRTVAVDQIENDYYITSHYDNDLSLYLWLPEGIHIVTIKHEGFLPYYRKVNSSPSGSLCEQVLPYSLTGSANITADDLITGIPLLTEDFSGLISPKTDYSVSASGLGDFIGTGSTAEINYSSMAFDSFTAVVYGDVDGDGLYDENDADIVQQIINGEINADDIGAAAYNAADADRNSTVDGSDVALLRKAGEFLDTIPVTDYGISDDWKIYRNIIDSSASGSLNEQITVTAQEEYEPSVGLALGQTLALSATYGEAGVAAHAEWASGNSEVAEVNANGTVTAKKAGFIKITATDAFGREGSFFVRVFDSSPRLSVYSMSGPLEMKVKWWKKYSSATMQFGYFASNCGDAVRYVWSSSSSRVKVDSDGFVTNTGIFSRSAEITLTAYDAQGNVTASESVRVSFYKFNWQRGM